MLGGVTVRSANKSLATLAKGGTGNDSDLFGVQKLFAKLLRGHSRGADAGEGVKRALGLTAGEAEFVESVYDQTAAHVVFLAHGGNGFVTLSDFVGET